MPERRTPVATREVLLLCLASTAFAVSGPLAKVVTVLTPIGVGCFRCLIAALVLLAVAPRQTVIAIARLTSRQRVGLIFAAAFLAAHFAAFLLGLGSTSLASAVSLVSLEPLSVIVVAWLVFGTRPSRRELLGVLVATVGALCVASGAGEGEHRTVGDLLVVAAVVIYGGYVASARGLRDAMPMIPYSASVYGLAALLLLPWALLSQPSFAAVPLRSWGLVTAVALIPTLVGHTLVQRAARYLPPALVALVSPGETVGGILVGILLFQTWPSPREATGAFLVVAGASFAVTR